MLRLGETSSSTFSRSTVCVLAQEVFQGAHKHAATRRCTAAACTLRATALRGTYTPKGRAGGSKNFLKKLFASCTDLLI